MVKAFFIGCSDPVYLDVAKRLESEHNWNILYWASRKRIKKPIQDAFPNCIFHDVLDAVRAIPACSCEGLARHTADVSLHRSIAHDQLLILDQMSRMGSGDAFTYEERIEHFYKLISYWRAVLAHLQPDIVVFPTAPHLIYDYILYVLCCRASVRTLMFEFPSVYPHLIYPVKRFENGLKRVIANYDLELQKYNGEDVILSQKSENYFSKARMSYEEGVPTYIRFKNIKANYYQAARSWKNIASYFVYPWKLLSVPTTLYHYIVDPAPENYLKLKGKTPEKSAVSGAGWRINRARRRQYKKRLKKYYDSISEVPRFERPYILVPLHFQPERTTNPMGGFYSNQLRMVDLLASCLPDGWEIYVKEVPSIFWPHITKQSFRSREYYDHLVHTTGVRVIDYNVDPFLLIDKSEIVATVTGTAAWEAVLRGKPALAFGYAWYLGCEGIFFVQNEKDCRIALKQVMSGYSPDLGKVRLFNKVLEEEGNSLYLENRFAKLVGIPASENTDRVANMFVNFLSEPS